MHLAGRFWVSRPVFARIYSFYHKFFDLSIENSEKFFPKIYNVQNGMALQYAKALNTKFDIKKFQKSIDKAREL